MGKTGRVGAAGEAGPRGAKGSAGSDPAPSQKRRKQFIASVDRHIENIYSELTVQMNRMARLQVQVDELREKIRKVL